MGSERGARPLTAVSLVVVPLALVLASVVLVLLPVLLLFTFVRRLNEFLLVRTGWEREEEEEEEEAEEEEEEGEVGVMSSHHVDHLHLYTP